MKKVYVAILLVVVLIAVSFFVYEFAQSPQQPSEDSEDLGIVFKTVEGEELIIEELLSQNKGLIIYFFATWCPTCEQDLRALDEVYSEQEWMVNVLVVGFDPTETPEKINTYKKNRNYTWYFAEYNKDAIIKYNVVTQSTKIAINKEGEVVQTIGFGVMGKTEWRELLQRIAP